MKQDFVSLWTAELSASPRAAILESWIRRQDSLTELARRKGYNRLLTSTSLPDQTAAFHYLLSKNILSPNVARAIQRLREIRNRVVRAPDFDPSPDHAREFVLYSAAIKEDLAKIKQATVT